ncbi:hypothetical protein DOY81_012186 [Sarcophaga bullata]|nr:hypothetical protein DOY81_012186 [Sarcophaga bullata]
MIRMMNKFSLIFVILNLTLLILLLPNVQCSKSTTSSSSSSSSSLTANSAATTCKELNQWNCYSSKMKDTFAPVKIKAKQKQDGITTRDIVANSTTKAAMAIVIVSVAKKPVRKDVKENKWNF